VARPAPAVDRATEILDFLAENPRDAFSLSELARRLDLNKASAHATLNALTDRGYLLRHPTRKDYRLGPRLIAVGEAAREQYPVVEFARDQLRRLSEDLGMECVASAAVGDEMVIVDRAGPVRPIGLSIAVGYRFPLVPPMGTVFMAWARAEEIDQWLRRVDASEAERDRYRAALAEVRAQGFSAGRGGDDYRLVEAAASPGPGLTIVGAPVFDAEGRVPVALFVVGLGDELGDDLPERLLEATAAITESIHGRRPDGQRVRPG
jgi:DNA-binding IclR family transcriptional regulator